MLLPLQGEGWDGDGINVNRAAAECSFPFKGKVGMGMGLVGMGMGRMKGQTNRNILQNRLQRRLRNSMTDAERRLWQCLKQQQMGGFKFRRQHPFGDYVVDFVCLDAMIVIEVDGGQHMENPRLDAVRTASLNAAGFRVLRFWNNEILQNLEAVKVSIWRALHTPPPPRSSP